MEDGDTGAVTVSAFPRKAADIEVNEVADGYVVYHPQRDRVHYLNHTAALVLELCTGETAADSMPGLIQGAFALAEPPEAEVRECLARFTTEGLVA